MDIEKIKEIKVTEAINWLESTKPELFLELNDKYRDIIESDDILGEHDQIKEEIENPEINILKRKAEFILRTAKEAELSLEQSLAIAKEHTKRARKWNLTALILSIVFSTSTFALLLDNEYIKQAQFIAAGTILSSFASLISGHFKNVSDGTIKLTAEDARDKLIKLRYDLKDGRNELELRMEFPYDKGKYENAIIFLNNVFKEINMIDGFISSL